MLYNYINKLENNYNFVIAKGKLNQKKSIPVRVISGKITNKNILKNNKVKKSSEIFNKI